jgi:hypothetical protein
MPTTAAAQSFVQQLMTAMLAALALAMGVNLLVFPISSRLVIFKELAGGITLLRGLVSLQKKYLASLEPDATFDAAMAAKALEETGAKMRELAGKMHADLPFAKRDIAWGKLDAKDLSEMVKLFRNVYIPVYVFGSLAPAPPTLRLQFPNLSLTSSSQTWDEHHH